MSSRYRPHAVFGASAVDDALAAWKAADQQWRKTFADAQAAAAAGDQAQGIALAAQSKNEFDRSVELKKVLDDVSAPPPLARAPATSVVTLFGLWRTSLNDWQIAVATKQDPKIVDGLSAIATQAQRDYLKTTPSLYRRWWDLNNAWLDAIHSPGTPPQQIAQLQGESEAVLAALARMPLAALSADLNGAWLSAIHDPGTPARFLSEVQQQAEAATAKLAKAPTKAASDAATTKTSTTTPTTSPAGGLYSAAIVTSPLWLFALFKGLSR